MKKRYTEEQIIGILASGDGHPHGRPASRT